MTGQQSLDILSKIETLTYTRTDRPGERRLGHIADQVEEALSELRVTNVTGSTNASLGAEAYGSYKTLQYDRIVPILVSAVNTLSARVQELESARRKKRNWAAASQPL